MNMSVSSLLFVFSFICLHSYLSSLFPFVFIRLSIFPLLRVKVKRELITFLAPRLPRKHSIFLSRARNYLFCARFSLLPIFRFLVFLVGSFTVLLTIFSRWRVEVRVAAPARRPRASTWQWASNRIVLKDSNGKHLKQGISPRYSFKSRSQHRASPTIWTPLTSLFRSCWMTLVIDTFLLVYDSNLLVPDAQVTVEKSWFFCLLGRIMSSGYIYIYINNMPCR